MPSTRILKMSFLRENFKESTNKIQVSSPTKSMPSGYEAVDTMVHLTPSPRPMSTSIRSQFTCRTKGYLFEATGRKSHPCLVNVILS